MISNIEMISKTSLNTLPSYDKNNIELLKNKERILLGNEQSKISVIEAKKGKYLNVLKGHDDRVIQIRVLFLNPLELIVSLSLFKIMKFWNNQNKRCLRTVDIYNFGFEEIFTFILYEANVITYLESIGLLFLNKMGQKIKEVEGSFEMDICEHMMIHQVDQLKLLIYSGSEGPIIIRNIDDNFQILKNISLDGKLISDLHAFEDVNTGRAKLLVNQSRESNFIIYDLKTFEIVENIELIKVMWESSNALYWKHFIIFFKPDEPDYLCFHKIENHELKEIIRINCGNLKRMKMLVDEEESEEKKNKGKLSIIGAIGSENVEYLYTFNYY